MKEYLITLVRQRGDVLQGRNTAREYLQARILAAVQRAGGMLSLAFQGGTALRFLYAMPRYSEDLDFSLERERERYDFRAYLRAVQRNLEREGYRLQIKVNDRKVVHSAFVRFPGLLYELELSPHPREVLAVKIEVDTRPPAGAVLSTTLVRRHVVLHLQHHDRASLLAGKLHAVLQRTYTKGRDLYDLFWYLGDPDWPSPNLNLLNNALRQTGWEGPALDEGTWRTVVARRIRTLDWRKVREDVGPFLEAGFDVRLLTKENLLRLLSDTAAGQ